MTTARRPTRRQIIARIRPIMATMHYWQMIGRMDRRAVVSDADHVRRCAAQLRAIQKELREYDEMRDRGKRA